LVADSAASEPRVMIDGDANARMLSYAEYAAFGGVTMW